MTHPDEPTQIIQGGPAGTGQATQTSPGGAKRAIPWLIGGTIVVVIAVIGAVVVFAGDDDAAASEVFLEPATSIGMDPFTDSVAEGSGPVVPEGAANEEDADPPPAAVQATPAATPGLYGGTRDQSSCNRSQLIEFLKATPDKAAAWADVQNIAIAEIETYVQSLTPVTLIDDIRVTNHGYAAGRATVIQSVLQSGTAVLVDTYGVPRVRCSCGNPLKPPTAVGKPVYTGPAWQWWSPGRVTVIATSTTIIDTFVLTDIPTGTIFSRPAGTAGDSDGDAPGTEPATTTTAPQTTTAPSPPPTTRPTAPPTEPLPTATVPTATEADVIALYFEVRDVDCATARYPNFEPHISETQSATPRGDGTWDLTVVGTTESGEQVFTWIVDPTAQTFTPTNPLANEAAAACAAWG